LWRRSFILPRRILGGPAVTELKHINNTVVGEATILIEASISVDYENTRHISWIWGGTEKRKEWLKEQKLNHSDFPVVTTQVKLQNKR